MKTLASCKCETEGLVGKSDFSISRIHTDADVLEFFILIFAFLITQPGVHFNIKKLRKLIMLYIFYYLVY